MGSALWKISTGNKITFHGEEQVKLPGPLVRQVFYVEKQGFCSLFHQSIVVWTSSRFQRFYETHFYYLQPHGLLNLIFVVTLIWK